MNTTLTDDEIATAIAHLYAGPEVLAMALPDELHSARAVIAAYEAKLAQQAPVAWLLRSGKARWVELENPTAHSALPRGTSMVPLYTHPAPQQADRHALQAQGKHPAPCARFCEANAFRIEIRQLRAQLKQADRQRVPQGWRFVRRADGIGIYAPTPNPEENARTGHTVPVEDRDLYDLLGKLADQQAAMLAAAPEAPAQDWTPTAENINALPEPVRKFVHELASNCDPAGTVRDLTIARDTIRALEASNRMLRDATLEAPAQAVPAEVDVRRILLDVVPGDDGMGKEVYAKTVDDVVRVLTELSEKADAQASAVDERAEFEAWAKAYGRVFLEVAPKLGRNGVTYKNQFTQEAWVGWQARAALAQLHKGD